MDVNILKKFEYFNVYKYLVRRILEVALNSVKLAFVEYCTSWN